MDDLFLLIAYQLNNIPSINTANNIKSRILNFDETYKGGLELEEQPYAYTNLNTTKHNFAGTVITIDQPNDDYFTISCCPLNKNLH